MLFNSNVIESIVLDKNYGYSCTLFKQSSFVCVHDYNVYNDCMEKRDSHGQNRKKI